MSPRRRGPPGIGPAARLSATEEELLDARLELDQLRETIRFQAKLLNAGHAPY